MFIILFLSTILAAVQASIPISVIARFGGAAYCENLFETQKYECNGPCSGPCNNTILKVAAIDDVTSGRGTVAYSFPLNTIFVTFRGTTSGEEAIQDSRIWLSNSDWIPSRVKMSENSQAIFGVPNMKVHAGIETIYIGLRQLIMNATSTLTNEFPTAKIIFVGHSLGGALSVLAAVDFYNQFGQSSKLSVYSFGQPRLGNSKWARFVNSLPFASRIFRIAVDNDIIVHLPPKGLFDYEHSTNPYLLREDGSISKCTVVAGTGEAESCHGTLLSSNPIAHLRKVSYFSMGDDC